MCYISNKFTPTLLLNPIKVYKIGTIKDGAFISIIRNYLYEPNILEYSNITIKFISGQVYIREALYSCSDNATIVIDGKIIYIKYNSTIILYGESIPNICIGEFVVPSAAYMDINDKGEIVSDKLILNHMKLITPEMNGKTFKEIFNEN